MSIMIIPNIRIEKVALPSQDDKIRLALSERQKVTERTTRRFCSPGIIVIDMATVCLLYWSWLGREKITRKQTSRKVGNRRARPSCQLKLKWVL